MDMLIEKTPHPPEMDIRQIEDCPRSGIHELLPDYYSCAFCDVPQQAVPVSNLLLREDGYPNAPIKTEI